MGNPAGLGIVTTNSFISVDIAAPVDLTRAERPRPIQLTPLPVHEKIAKAWRPLLGRCLLQLPRMAWMAMDVAIVWIGIAVGHRMFVWWDAAAGNLGDINLWVANVVLGSSVVFAGGIFGLYEPRTLWARSRILVRCMLTIALAMAITWVVMHLLMYSALSRRAAASGTAIFLLTAPAVRLLAHRAIRFVRRGLLVIGQGPTTGLIIRSVRRGSVPGYRLVGLVSNRSDASARPPGDIPVIGHLEEVESLCRQHDVAEVVVADRAADDPGYQRAALTCLRLGCRVTNETTFYETAFGEVPVAHITPNWFLVADLKGQREEHAVLKRVLDLAMALFALLVTAPLWPLIALAIRLEDGGHVFYRQTRVGQGGRHFTLHKFRTMRRDAEVNGSSWAAPNDPRVTWVGRWLRCTRLDELPQLWNILRGDMSFVGPRPERPEFVGPLASLIPFYAERHLIKPGLTGWAQINYRYGATVADARKKLQLELYYIKHMSLELDLVILLRTFGTFFLGSR